MKLAPCHRVELASRTTKQLWPSRHLGRFEGIDLRIRVELRLREPQFGLRHDVVELLPFEPIDPAARSLLRRRRGESRVAAGLLRRQRGLRSQHGSQHLVGALLIYV